MTHNATGQHIYTHTWTRSTSINMRHVCHCPCPSFRWRCCATDDSHFPPLLSTLLKFINLEWTISLSWLPNLVFLSLDSFPSSTQSLCDRLSGCLTGARLDVNMSRVRFMFIQHFSDQNFCWVPVRRHVRSLCPSSSSLLLCKHTGPPWRVSCPMLAIENTRQTVLIGPWRSPDPGRMDKKGNASSAPQTLDSAHLNMTLQSVLTSRGRHGITLPFFNSLKITCDK